GSAHHAERRAEDVRIGEAPPRVIQDVVEGGKQLETRLLSDPECLRQRNVPLERILVAQEKQLPEFTGSRVREQELRVGAAVGADQARINGQPLQVRNACSAGQARPLRVKQLLNLVER